MPDVKPLTGYPSVDKPWLKYYSEEAINALLPEMSIFEWIAEHNKVGLTDCAINYLGYKITYENLFRMIDSAASAFAKYGVKKDDIVTIALPNIPENIIAIYALNKIGAIANLIDLRCQGSDLIRYYNEVGSSVAVVSDIFLDNTLSIADQTAVKTLIVASPYDHLFMPIRMAMQAKYSIRNNSNFTVTTWRRFIKDGRACAIPNVTVDADKTACILHTSGTTGESKGVMLSNRAFNAMALQCIHDGFEYRTGDRCLNQVPPFLAYNTLLSTHLPLSLHMEIELLPDYRPDIFARNIMKYRPNHAMAGPADWSNFLAEKRLKDLSFLRSLLSGSDTIRADIKNKINRTLEKHGCKGHVMEGYGMTEVGSAACTNLPQIDVAGSVGIPLPKTTFCIYDNEQNRELPYHEKGEICISGPTVMNGYYNRPEETAAVLRDHGDGIVWMHTGDMGHIDENGCVFLEGRLKRIIIQYNGMKINPYEVEKVLLKDEGVSECCVVGGFDKAHGSGAIPIAFVVAETEMDTKEIEARLRSLCDAELVERYRPAQYRFIDQLPLTPNGKVDYRKLEKRSNRRRQ